MGSGALPVEGIARKNHGVDISSVLLRYCIAGSRGSPGRAPGEILRPPGDEPVASTPCSFGSCFDLGEGSILDLPERVE